MSHVDRGAGRLRVVADDPGLTPHAGLAVVGDLARHLDLVGLIDGELAAERRARPVKTRRRGVSAGGLLVSLAECQLVGGAFFEHLEDLRADSAGAPLRAVGEVPSAPAALQVSKRFRRVHCQRAERAMSRAGQRLDRALGREAGEPVTIDLDATQITVYGRGKDGAARCRTGQMSYAPHIAFWAQRGRALTAELVGGNQERLSGADCATIATRAIKMLPAGHGPVDMRIDSAYYAVDLLHRLRKEHARFTVSVPRNKAMWKTLTEIPDGAWTDALQMAGAQVAETTYRPAGWQHEPLRLIIRRVPFRAEQIAALRGSRRLATIHPDQLQMALDGQIDSVYGYSFILTDHPHQHTAWVEHRHRHRAQIEERLKDAKNGQALRHLPSGDINANRVWMTAALLAVNITAWICDLSPATGASGTVPKRTPLRRHAHTLRRILFNIPARIIRSARRITLRLPTGYRHADTLHRTLDAVYALPPP
ncbi:MAG: IS1380 family transposase [Actinobacteria bacterium]|nr:IS1380 family transposase [Actinomycetota bacterium]